MSIIIKGMKMPKSCSECPITMKDCKQAQILVEEQPTVFDAKG